MTIRLPVFCARSNVGLIWIISIAGLYIYILLNVFSDMPESRTKEVLSMKRNIGTIDRALRAIIGIALIAWAFFGAGEFAWAG